MKHFPIFLSVKGRRIALAGGGAEALAKLRLLVKTEARIQVFAKEVVDEIAAFAAAGKIDWVRRDFAEGDAYGAALVYGATGDEDGDAETARIARAEGVPVNRVDDLEGSDFITPAIVDRDPVTVAIGTEGAAPVLARAIKADFEARLPRAIGVLARIGKGFRTAAEALPKGRVRRDFWSDYYFRVGPQSFDLEGEAGLSVRLAQLLESHLGTAAREGHVNFVGAGPGDPELLTLKARRALDEADVVIHDRLVTPQILELARREATIVDAGKEGFGPSATQEEINALIVAHALKGAQVVRLKSGDPTMFGRLDEEIDACTAAGVAFAVIPGITSASAAVAAIGQSLTRRGRNSAVRFVTGHDMKGFAEHDWRALAQPGEVAAIYMGRKSARFLQGRLMMHGAAPQTPVTIIENASRPDQRVVSARLGTLAKDIAPITGPALMLYGLAPRAAEPAITDLKEELVL